MTETVGRNWTGPGTVRCTIVLEFDNGGGSVVKRVEVMWFHRSTEDQTPGDVGLSLAEGKSLLNCVQQEFVVEQFERFCASRIACVGCRGRAASPAR
jgi:hypothetical protein